MLFWFDRTDYQQVEIRVSYNIIFDTITAFSAVSSSAVFKDGDEYILDPLYLNIHIGFSNILKTNEIFL